MLTLNVSFGIYAFLPQGWLFMTFIILLECVVMTKLLNRNWFNKRIFGTATLSNLTSGIIGIVTTMILSGGWFLVVWFPWVSSHEINISKSENLKGLIIFYIIAFVLSILIELLVNWLLLRKRHKTKRIIISTLIANIASYLIGTIALYSYSFG